jgi:hypothetical protein
MRLKALAFSLLIFSAGLLSIRLFAPTYGLRIGLATYRMLDAISWDDEVASSSEVSDLKPTRVAATPS